ncbi:MAG: hypothetical protein WBX25_32870 [Rhodomicrobium sp.]
MINTVSAYIERWNPVFGIIFVLIISFMPEGLIPVSIRLVQKVRQVMRRPSSVPAEAGAASFRLPAGHRTGGTT